MVLHEYCLLKFVTPCSQLNLNHIHSWQISWKTYDTMFKLVHKAHAFWSVNTSQCIAAKLILHISKNNYATEQGTLGLGKS